MDIDPDETSAVALNNSRETLRAKLRTSIHTKAEGRQRGAKPLLGARHSGGMMRGGGGTGTATPAPNFSMKDLEMVFAKYGGDVDAMIKDMGLPADIADIAKTHAATPPEQRDIKAALQEAQNALRQKP